MSIFENLYGTTPIDDISDLIPTHISTRDELNEWESANILKATRKFLTKRKQISIDIEFIRKLHKHMFDKTWKWAGKFRTKNLNIGVDWYNIKEQIKLLVDDISYWKEHKTIGIFEQSVRLHHRLSKIHPFINGNGRHARLVSDIFLFSNGYNIPDWPDGKMIEKTVIRKEYIDAIKSADIGDYSLLEKVTKKLIK